ncbi:MAG: HAD family hydrolase [Bacteroidales bacterium]
MDYSSIRIIASDMDGTLLNSEHKYSPLFPKLFEEMYNNDILFVAASGRQYHNLIYLFDEYKDRMAFAAENGSYLVYKGEELLVEALDHSLVRKMVEVSRTIPGVYTLLCGKKKCYIESTEEEFMEHFTQYFHQYEVVSDLLDIPNDDILKVTICDIRGSEEYTYPHFKDYQDSVLVKVSGQIWLDISSLKANKGNAIRCLQEYIGATAEQTMTFGDYLNDLEMLSSSYFSFAMANAHPEVKATARFMAEDNDSDGVVNVIKDVIASRSLK